LFFVFFKKLASFRNFTISLIIRRCQRSKMLPV